MNVLCNQSSFHFQNGNVSAIDSFRHSSADVYKVATPLWVLPALRAVKHCLVCCANIAQNTAWNICAVIQTAVYSVNMAIYS